MRLPFPVMLLAACADATAQAPDCTPAAGVALDKIQARAIVVGEIHGTAEVPAFIGQLACSLLKQGRPVIVALERDGAEQVALNRYLDSEGLPADRQALLASKAWTYKMQDGRNSQAMLALIEQLRQWRHAGQRAGVLAMQTEFLAIAPADSVQRLSEADQARLNELNDSGMAAKTWQAMAAYPSYTVVALAGNMHTAVGSKQRAASVPSPSFADVLANYAAIHVIGLNSSGGSSWNLTREGGSAVPRPGGPLFMRDSRIDSQADVGKISASPPAGSN